MSKKREDFWLFFVLMIAVTPLAFLLMPVLAVLVFIGAIVMVVITIRKYYGTPSH